MKAKKAVAAAPITCPGTVVINDKRKIPTRTKRLLWFLGLKVTAFSHQSSDLEASCRLTFENGGELTFTARKGVDELEFKSYDPHYKARAKA